MYRFSKVFGALGASKGTLITIVKLPMAIQGAGDALDDPTIPLGTPLTEIRFDGTVDGLQQILTEQQEKLLGPFGLVLRLLFAHRVAEIMILRYPHHQV